MAVAKALCVADPSLIAVLSPCKNPFKTIFLKPFIGGLLRQDNRKVERKKAGQPKSRKKFTWVKR